MTSEEKTKELARREKLKTRMRDKLRAKKKDPSLELTTEQIAEIDNDPFIVEGYVGKPKGMRQKVWLRGGSVAFYSPFSPVSVVF